MEPRGRGRPREPDVDERILATAMRLMARHGYARMSVDAVAHEAGVAKPTIYLRYPNKAALATAALAAYCRTVLPPLTGDTRADLAAGLRHLKDGIEAAYGMSLLGTLLVEERDTPDLLALYREQIVLPLRGLLRATLTRAQARGELAPGAEIEYLIHALVGSYYARYVAAAPIENDWPERTVDALLAGVFVRPPQDRDEGKM